MLYAVGKVIQQVSFCNFASEASYVYWDFPSIFVLLKLTCLVTLFDHKLQVFKNLQNLQKLTIFGIPNELLVARNVNIARFARNVKGDFLEYSNIVFSMCDLHS